LALYRDLSDESCSEYVTERPPEVDEVVEVTLPLR
jgi:hypothetical protein